MKFAPMWDGVAKSAHLAHTPLLGSRSGGIARLVKQVRLVESKCARLPVRRVGVSGSDGSQTLVRHRIEIRV
jgi:hypothetical protein